MDTPKLGEAMRPAKRNSWSHPRESRQLFRLLCPRECLTLVEFEATSGHLRSRKFLKAFDSPQVEWAIDYRSRFGNQYWMRDAVSAPVLLRVVRHEDDSLNIHGQGSEGSQ